MDKQPCVYILASGRCGALYTGVTSDLIARLYQHREGITKGWAAEKFALHLVWYEMHGEMESVIRASQWNPSSAPPNCHSREGGNRLAQVDMSLMAVNQNGFPPSRE